MFKADDTTIICIDIQEKLVRAVNNPKVEANVIKLMKAVKLLNVDTIVTEQYPKGLGSTVFEIKEISDFKTIEKETFSAFQTDTFKEEFLKLKNKNILIFGIETHICVLQTALDFIKEGYNVFVVKDCCASREEFNHNSAIDIMIQKGITPITLEIALFEFLKSSKHPNFKEVQALIK